MLKYDLSRPEGSELIERAVEKVLDQGYRTGDIYSEGFKKVGTKEMSDAVVNAIKSL